MHTVAHRGPRTCFPLELELHMVGKYPVQFLGTKLKSPARVVSVLIIWAIFSLLTIYFKITWQELARWQWLRALSVPASNPGSIPSTHSKQLTTIYNSSYRETSILFWSLAVIGMYVAHTHTHTYVSKTAVKWL